MLQTRKRGPTETKGFFSKVTQLVSCTSRNQVCVVLPPKRKFSPRCPSVYLLCSVNEKARLLYPLRRGTVAHRGQSTWGCCKAPPAPTCIVKAEQEFEERFHPKRSRVKRASGHQTLWPRVMRPSQGCC